MNPLPHGFSRKLRLWTGMILFAYATMHFLNHALGIRSLEAMQEGAFLLLRPWQSMPGRTLLYGALLTHAGLGLYALYRRRHLRIPTLEALQLTLGLAIPALLIAHSVAVVYGESVFGLKIGFDRVVYQYWVADPIFGLPRQFLLMIFVWIHGCIGIRAWLRSKPWYADAVPALTALATLVPVLAILGFINAGLDMRDFAFANPALLPTHVVDVPGTEQARKVAAVGRFVDNLTLGYIALVAAIFALRWARDWHAARFRAVRLTYPGGRIVTVPTGFSVLEASRWAGIPHASVCGGRGRCSTCRVDVIAGGESLPPPGHDEQNCCRASARRHRYASLARYGPKAISRSYRWSTPQRPHGPGRLPWERRRADAAKPKWRRCSSIFANRRSLPTIGCPTTPSSSSSATSNAYRRRSAPAAAR